MSALATDVDLTPGSPAWARLVTASKVAAILGLSPWDSPRSIWHKMHGDLPWDAESEAMRRGNMLENAVLDWWLADTPLAAEIQRQPFYPMQDWAGATPDMVAALGGELQLVDAKTTSTDDEWGTPGTDEVPAYYLASSHWQLAMCPDAQRVRLAVLFGRPFTLREYVIERDDELAGQIIDRCRAFYDTLTADEPPALDDHPATYDAIRRLHPDIDREAVADLTEDQAREYIDADLAFKAAEVRAKAAKSVVLDVMSDARRAFYLGVCVARRQPNQHGVSLVRTAATIEGEPS